MKRLFAIVVVAVLVGAATLIVRMRSAPSIDAARAAIDSGRTGDAIQILRQRLAENTSDSEANFLLGELLLESDPGAARSHLQKVPRGSEFYPQALRFLAGDAMLRGDFAAAEPLLVQLLHRFPNDADVCLAAAEMYFGTARFDLALPLARRAAELKPSRAETYVLIADILDELGRISESVAPLREALQRDPELFVAHANLAYALHFRGELEAAQSEIAWCLKRDPDNVKMLLLEAKSMRDEGRFDDALKLTDRILGLDAGLSDARMLKAEMLLFQNRPAEAVECLEATASANGENQHYLALLARSYRLAGQSSRADDLQSLIRSRLKSRGPERDTPGSDSEP